MNASALPANDPACLDVREISCREKHPLIFRRWTDLAVGTHFVLVNDHDPVPLYYQFAAQFPNAFTWEYLVAGPDEFQVKITRTAATPDTLAPRPPVGGCHSGPQSTSGPASEGGCAGAAMDLRGLEPPEPMLRILAAVETLAPGAQLQALTDRKPVHLLAELDRRGITYTSHEQADASWVNTFGRP